MELIEKCGYHQKEVSNYQRLDCSTISRFINKSAIDSKIKDLTPEYPKRRSYEYMDIFDDKESYEVVIIGNDKEFRDFLKSTPSGLLFVSEEYSECEGLVMKEDAGDFAKWLRQKQPELHVEVHKANKQLVLRSSDIWLPLVFLASDVALPVYLNLVANYIYDRIRGALRGGKPRVHLEAMYEDKHKGVVKEFHFEGDSDGFQQVIKQFDLNKFIDK